MTDGAGPLYDPDRLAAVRARLDKTGAAPPTPNSRFTKPLGLQNNQSRAAVKMLWQRAIVLTLGFVAVLYVIEAINTVSGGALDRDGGVRPRTTGGLDGIIFAPLLHASWSHLIGNTLPVLVLGLLALLTGIGRGLAATAIIWVLSEVGTWLTGDSNSINIGASVLVFGWLTYLISRGFFARNLWQILIGLVVGLVYGSILFGVLPGQPGISWQGHLFGAVGGLVAGWVLSGDERRHRRGDTADRLASAG